jgi:hypothetical protein
VTRPTKMKIRKVRIWYAWCPEHGYLYPGHDIYDVSTHEAALALVDRHLERAHDVVLTGR